MVQKVIRNFSRILTGLVFIFSGFVKGIDPLGSTYKFIDYFEAFGIEWFAITAFPLAVLLGALEFGLGVALLLNVLTRLSTWVVLFFMSFFTVLTFVLAIFNPVSDCGCFGDAIILTNWQTFYKNIILMAPVLVIFFDRKKFVNPMPQLKQMIVGSLGILLMVVISVHCYNHLPWIDFRPYNLGTYIPEKMIIPDDAPQPVYESTFIYQKEGIEQEFTLENLPDSTWEFVDVNHELISAGYEPPIHDFTIETTDGDDITDIVLSDNKFTFIFIAYDINKSSTKNLDEIINLYRYLQTLHNANFIALTASLDEDVLAYKENNNIPFEFYNTDEITLKTIVRANPGLLLLKNGTIMGKWHHKHLPEIEDLSKDFLLNPIFETETVDDDITVNV